MFWSRLEFFCCACFSEGEVGFIVRGAWLRGLGGPLGGLGEGEVGVAVERSCVAVCVKRRLNVAAPEIRLEKEGRSEANRVQRDRRRRSKRIPLLWCLYIKGGSRGPRLVAGEVVRRGSDSPG